MDLARLTRRRAVAPDAEAAAGGALRAAVTRHGVVDEEDLVAARDADPVPGVAVDRVVDDVVRAAVGAERDQTVPAVAVDEGVGDERVGVTAADRDSPVAGPAAVADDAQPLEVDRQVLVVPAQE